MCLIALAWRSHPEYPLVLAANRDEFHRRPTRPADFWPEAPEVLAGRDLEAGGSWLGMTRTGRLAALSNVRDGVPSSGPRSRGELVSDFLLGNQAAADYLEEVRLRAEEYGGFNLLVGEVEGGLHYFSNRLAQPPRALEARVHGVSNGRLNECWPKVCRLCAALEALPERQSQAEVQVFETLADPTQAADAQLPDTGVGLERERQLSPVFIVNPEYGTRASTLIVVDRAGCTTFEERRFGPDGKALGRTRRRFQLVQE